MVSGGPPPCLCPCRPPWRSARRADFIVRFRFHDFRPTPEKTALQDRVQRVRTIGP